jgi:alpha/beta superfamily hydrolase
LKIDLGIKEKQKKQSTSRFAPKKSPIVKIENTDDDFVSMSMSSASSMTSMSSTGVQMGIETSHFKTEKLSEYATALSNRRRVEPSSTLLPQRNDEE